MQVNYLDKFRYKYDDLNELGRIEKNIDEKKKYNIQN